MRELSALSRIRYRDEKAQVSLECYADTLVYRKLGSTRILAAIRFGGYPEQTRAMCDAIYGGGSLEADVENHVILLSTLPKQYRRTLSHDGIYAEAMLMANDDCAIDAIADDENTNQETAQKRKQFIFCEMGNKDALFDAVDQKTTVPLIPAFRDYVLNELEQRRLLIPLQVLSASTRFDAWILDTRHDERDVIAIINSGLQSTRISIPGSAVSGNFRDVSTVAQYLKRFGVTVANRIKESFQALFDPLTDGICDKLKKINGYLFQKAGYTLYPAQLAVAEAIKRRLDVAKLGLIIAECGSGKTKIGVSALAAHQTKKSFNVVMCPSHITKKWVREIAETVPNSVSAVVHSISAVNRLYRQYQEGKQSVYLIMSKERARDGYMKKPAVCWSRSRKVFVCPTCGGTAKMKVFEGESAYRVDADHFYFMKETNKNHTCKHCGGSLWTAINPANLDPRTNQWVKISDYGFIHRRFAEKHLKRTRNKKILDKIEAVLAQPNGIFPTAGAYRRYPVSAYIKKHLKQVDGLILDELHQYKGDSGQGAAMAELICAAKKVVGMTATLINGYSGGIFYLLFRVAPGLMLADGKAYAKVHGVHGA